MYFHWPGSQGARQRSAKPLYAGAIPAQASETEPCRGGGIGIREGLKIL